MTVTKEVDVSVNDRLKKIRDSLNREKNERFLGKRKTKGQFHIFHALETQIRVINQMMQRVENAHKAHDNPQVARDALATIPYIFSLQEVLGSEVKDDRLTVVDMTTRLQSISMKNKMYPPSKEVMKSANKRAIRELFRRFAEKAEITHDKI